MAGCWDLSKPDARVAFLVKNVVGCKSFRTEFAEGGSSQAAYFTRRTCRRLVCIEWEKENRGVRDMIQAYPQHLDHGPSSTCAPASIMHFQYSWEKRRKR